MDLDDDDLEWLLDEFTITAERARDRGMTPVEFVAVLQRYGKRFMDDYSMAGDAPASEESDA